MTEQFQVGDLVRAPSSTIYRVSSKPVADEFSLSIDFVGFNPDRYTLVHRPGTDIWNPQVGDRVEYMGSTDGEFIGRAAGAVYTVRRVESEHSIWITGGGAPLHEAGSWTTKRDWLTRMRPLATDEPPSSETTKESNVNDDDKPADSKPAGPDITEAHKRDVEIIFAALEEEAIKREWCPEWDTFRDALKGKLNYAPPTPPQNRPQPGDVWTTTDDHDPRFVMEGADGKLRAVYKTGGDNPASVIEGREWLLVLRDGKAVNPPLPYR